MLAGEMELELDRERFIATLGALMRMGPSLVNAVDAGKVPREGLAADLVTAALAPGLARGAVRLERIAAPGHEERPNLVLTVPGRGAEQVAVVGAHFDVVAADQAAEGWQRDPFELAVEDGVLHGRGTTDCLGHVALLTELVRALGARTSPPRRTLVVVLIANEESSPITGVGLDYLASIGRLDPLAAGPVYWLDAADFGPTVGTGGVARFRLTVDGIAGHSGMPQQCVNALELGMALVLQLGRWFRAEFPPLPAEASLGFLSPSSLKATVIDAPNRGVSTIPGRVVIEGDLRATPFYSVTELMARLSSQAEGLGRAIAAGESLPDLPSARTAHGATGRVRFDWVGTAIEGIACDLESPALTRLEAAIRRRRGPDAVQRIGMTGSLPLVGELQRRGMDVQITGFGQGRYYHAANEQALLQDFADGFAVLQDLVERD